MNVGQGHAGLVQPGGLWVGTSGYEYADWRGKFYPPELPRRQWLAAYAARFATIEMNRTFYGLPDRSLFAQWRAKVPPSFRFSVKFSQYATHRKRLKNPEEPIARFMEACAPLGGQCGPVLVQLPPFRVDVGRLRAFLQAPAGKGVRWVFEFRDESWLCDGVYQALADHQAALCIHDLLPRHPFLLTANWSYLRYHGVKNGGRYSAEQLTKEAHKVVDWLRMGCDVYTYFNNDKDAHAVEDAQIFQSLLEAWLDLHPAPAFEPVVGMLKSNPWPDKNAS